MHPIYPDLTDRNITPTVIPSPKTASRAVEGVRVQSSFSLNTFVEVDSNYCQLPGTISPLVSGDKLMKLS